MAFGQSLMAFGLSPFTTSAILGDVANGLTAVGTTQANALALSAVNSIITTAAAGTGVRLMPTGTSDDVWVVNLGANALLVYPVVGGSIQGGAANASFSIPAGKTAMFTARDASGNMFVNLSA